MPITPTTHSISVVIPTRGRPQLVARAVRSALKQTLAPREVVVVIDGPDPQTRDALASFGDARVRVICMECSVGGAEARNVGARAAEGEWIALLDDDDEWLPVKLERQMEAAEQTPGTNIVVCRHFLRAAGTQDVIRPRRMPRDREPISEFMFDYLCYFQTSTFVCRRSLLLQIPFPTGLAFYQDIDWFLRANRDVRTRLAIVAEPLTIYYEPGRRVSITSKTPWTMRLEWGKANRHLMSRKAYSRFVVGSCAARAVEEHAGVGGLVLLLRECILGGRANLKLLILLAGIYSLSPQHRRALRDRFLLRRIHQNDLVTAPEGM